MAGHSKWKNIQHRKERQDALRGKMFAKLAREIYVSAYQGDKDPANNQKLRMAILKAKSHNMPNDNIDRALKKASGEIEGKVYEEVTYEGYGPNGVAVMVETLTDNRNRTAADMRYAFSKYGGNLGESGCVSWMFERKGFIFIKQGTSGMDEENLMLFVLDHQAEDVEIEGDGYMVVCSPENVESLRTLIEQEGFIVSMVEVTFVPSNKIELDEGQVDRLNQLVDVLEEYDDVQNVYTNIDTN